MSEVLCNKGLCKVVLNQGIKDKLQYLYNLTILSKPEERMMYTLNQWGVKRSRWVEYEELVTKNFKECEVFYEPFVFYTVTGFLGRDKLHYVTTAEVDTLTDVMSMSLVSDVLYLTPQQARIIYAAKLVSFD